VKKREPPPAQAPVFVTPARYVRIGPTAEAATGIPLSSMEKKIERGEWMRDREWVKGPDGRRYLDLRAYEAWVTRASDPAPSEYPDPGDGCPND